MSKATKRKTGKGNRPDAVQLAARRERDALRRAIARETEITRLTKVLLNAQTRRAVAVDYLRNVLNEQAPPVNVAGVALE